MTDKENIRAYSFLFQANVGKLTLPVKFPCSIKLLWKRSGETASLGPTPLENGAIRFNETISLKVNMYFDITVNKFLEKKSVFSLILVTPKGEKSAGTVSVDLATKLNEQVSEYHGVYPLEKCPVSGSTLEFTITSHILGQKELDKMSQMTSAVETGVQVSGLDTSALDTSGVGLSVISNSGKKSEEQLMKSSASSANTQQTTDLLNFDGGSNSMTDNILKINDTTTKISQFIGQFGNALKTEMSNIKQTNQNLAEQLQNERIAREALEEQLRALKVSHENLKSQATVIGQSHEKSLIEAQNENKTLLQRLQLTQKARRSLQSSSMAGDEEKLRYINQVKEELQKNTKMFEQEKSRLQGLLRIQQETVTSLKTTNFQLQNELKSTKQSLDQTVIAKRDLEAERKDQEQEVEAARLRLEKVYGEMMNALQGII